MQSIAPDTIKIVVTGEGVTISGQKRPVGWEGEVSRASAKYLLDRNMARRWVTPVKPTVVAESVDASPAVEYDAKEPATGAEEAKVSGSTTRITRNRNK